MANLILFKLNLVQKIVICLKLVSLISLVDSNDNQPLLQEIPVPKNINENQIVKLSCDLIQGKQPIKIEWYFKNRKIEDDSKYKIRVTEDFANLMIRSLSIDDLGEYFCLASNEFGNHKRYASVYVNSKFNNTINYNIYYNIY